MSSSRDLYDYVFQARCFLIPLNLPQFDLISSTLVGCYCKVLFDLKAIFFFTMRKFRNIAPLRRTKLNVWSTLPNARNQSYNSEIPT